MSREPLPPEHPLRPLADLLDREAVLEDDGDGPDRAELLAIDTTLAELGSERIQQLVLSAARLLYDEEMAALLPRLRSSAEDLRAVHPDRRRPRAKA